jgi:hypothetical protein
MVKLNAKRRGKMLARIMAYDLVSILDDADKGDLSYLVSWLTGDGLTQYKNMSNEDLLQEWREGEYEGETKKAIVGSSRWYQHPFIRQLWVKGNSSGMWDGRGHFFPLGGG